MVHYQLSEQKRGGAYWANTSSNSLIGKLLRESNPDIKQTFESLLKGGNLVTSNRESGFGRYDVMLESLNKNDDAMILEFKVFQPKKEKELSDTVKAALNQIEDKNYEAVLTAKGIAGENIRKYGFTFCGKEVLIGQKNEMR